MKYLIGLGHMNKYSKWIVPLVIMLNVLFVYYVFDLIKFTGAIPPDSLIYSWFAFTTGELWMLASIKKTKEIENTKKKRDC